MLQATCRTWLVESPVKVVAEPFTRHFAPTGVVPPQIDIFCGKIARDTKQETSAYVIIITYISVGLYI